MKGTVSATRPSDSALSFIVPNTFYKPGPSNDFPSDVLLWIKALSPRFLGVNEPLFIALCSTPVVVGMYILLDFYPCSGQPKPNK